MSSDDVVATLILLSALCIVGCKDTALRGHVDKSCASLAGDVERTAQKYEEFAAWAKGRTADETWDQQELTLPCRWKVEGRGACAGQLAARVQFCINAKKGDTKTIDDLGDRVAVAIDQFSVSSDPSVVAAAARELATISASIRKMDTKD